MKSCLTAFFSLLIMLGTFGAVVNESDVVKPQFYDIFHGIKERIYLDGEWEMTEGPLKKMLIPNFVDVKLGGAHTVKREFEWSGNSNKRLILTFWGISWNPTVWINGEKAAEYQNLSPGWISEFFTTDISKLVKPGKNEIKVRYEFPNRQGRLLTGGIYAPVFIEVVDPVYASEILITPHLPDKITVKCTVENTTGAAVNAQLTAEVKPWKGNAKATTIKLGGQALKPGSNELSFEAKINDPVLWDLENPHLYLLTLKSAQNMLGMERFGLREFTIKDNEFMLNGKPFYCYGLAAEEGNLERLMVTECFNPQFINNGGDLYRTYLENIKKANINTLIRHPQLSRTMNNLSDEIGIVNFHGVFIWKMYTQLPVGIPERILKPGFEYDKLDKGYFSQGGKLLPAEAFNLQGRDQYMSDIFARIGSAVRNNPSVVAILSGDENFRECNQAFDLPTQRAGLYRTAPGLLFAGMHGIQSDSMDLTGQRKALVPQQDFVNFAGLACGGAAEGYSHYTVWPQTLKWCAENWVYNPYGKKLPIFADESLFYGDTRTLLRRELWNMTLKSYSPIQPGTKLNREEMVKILGKPEIVGLYQEPNVNKRDNQRLAPVKNTWWPFRRAIKLIGLQDNFLDKDVVINAIGGRIRRMTEMVRIYDHYMQGVGAVTGPVLRYDADGLMKLAPGAVGSLSAIGEAFKHGYAPVMVCLDIYEKCSSSIAGEKIKLNLYVFNNTAEPIGKTETEIRLAGQTIKVPVDMTGRRKVSCPVEITVPATLATGDYKLEMTLKGAGRELAVNSYELFILGRKDMTVGGRVQVMASPDSSLLKLLAKLGVEAETVSDVSKLTTGGRLIIGPGALPSNCDALREFMTSGGKILLLEQSLTGPNPLIPEYSVIKLDHRSAGKIMPAVGIDLLIVDPANPAFNQINRRAHWFTFNSQYGEVFNTLIGPLDTNAAAIGADVGRGESARAFGSLLINKGNLTWSQVEAGKAAELNDGVATLYLINLIKQLQGK